MVVLNNYVDTEGKTALIACEESQEICKALRQKGVYAFSCDILEPSGNHPEWHILGDCLPYINGNCEFTTMNGQHYQLNGPWDLLIAHPPCTRLAVSGNRWYNVERYGDAARQKLKEREEAADFFMKFINADCEHIAVENPIGVMNTRFRKPDQIIQPYWFGHPVSKSTCLWLKNLPNLVPTNMVKPEKIHSKGASGGYSGNSWQVYDERGKVLKYNDPRTAAARSKTFPGVAEAIANQWSEIL